MPVYIPTIHTHTHHMSTFMIKVTMFLHSFYRMMNVVFFCGVSFFGESMHDDSSLVFAYYKEGATDPTFLYFAHGLKEIKC